MRIKPIRNHTDLDAAWTRLDAIFDAAPGTAKGNEAEVLLQDVKAAPKRPTPRRALRKRRHVAA